MISSLSLFFPAYNEELNIAQSVAQAEQILRRIAKQYEIIIVNDGSKDSTGAIADELSAKDNHIKVVHHSPNQGYGAAVWSGVKAAQYDYVFFTDADLQFDLQELEQLVQFIPEYQVVIGYRAKRRDPFMRILNAKSWNILNRLLFGLKVKDIDCAFKLFDRRLIQSLETKSRGAMLSAEILIRLQRQGVKFKEVPVTHLPRTMGSATGAKPSVILRAFKELIEAYRGELGNVTQKQAIKFMIIGGANTILDLALYYLATRYIAISGEHLVVTKAITFGLASLSSFFSNRHWTFVRTGPIVSTEVVRFYAVVGVGLAINAGSLAALLPVIHSDIPAVLLATLLSFTWNFTFSKLWVFRPTLTETIKSV